MRSLLIGVTAVALSFGSCAFVLAPALNRPEAQVSRYLVATSLGDEAAALDAWVIARQYAPLLARRTEVTRELAARRAGRTYTVRSIEWWATCCTPRPISDEREAGLARIHVSATDEDGTEERLVFEVQTTRPYAGGAEGYPTREWALYEVHREGDLCVYSNWAFGCAR